MRKFAIVILLIPIIALGIFILNKRGTQMDEESKSFVDDVIPKIVSDWNQEVLEEHVSEDFKKVSSRDDLEGLFKIFRKLGKLVKYEGAEGHVLMSLSQGIINIFKVRGNIRANYVAKAVFEKGPAVIHVSLVKKEDKWFINGFRVDSKAFLEIEKQ